MNCHGLVHVKLLVAQHLPCGAGSSLQASISLPPWNGRIRSSSVVAFQGTSKTGVCARWDTEIDAEGHTLNKDPSNEFNTCYSMVHSYNSEDTPIPAIKIELQT